MRRPKRVHRYQLLVFLLGVALMSVASHAAPDSDLWEFWAASDERAERKVEHQPWQQLLDKFLDSRHPSGVYRFDYAAVDVPNRAALDSYLAALAAEDPRSLSRAEQLPYWINLYNALTVQVILDHYPVDTIRRVHGGLLRTGPWDRELITIAGQRLSLNDIEHRILRPLWQDDRIHYAVNCASIGCPNLAPQAYTPENTEQLLNAGASDFINHSRGLRLEDNRLQLSSIFNWYREDFASDEPGLLLYLAGYAKPALAEQLKNFDGRITYDYNWRLNEP